MLGTAWCSPRSPVWGTLHGTWWINYLVEYVVCELHTHGKQEPLGMKLKIEPRTMVLIWCVLILTGSTTSVGHNCDHTSNHDNKNLINSPFSCIIESRARSLRLWSRVCWNGNSWSWFHHLWSLSVVAWMNFETWNSKLSDSHVVSTSFNSPCDTIYIHIQ